VIFGKGL